jgi:hypothetical protein
MYGLIFSTTFIWNISHSRNSTRCCHKCENVPVILVRFSKKKKKAWISDFIDRRPMGAELFHSDRQTDGRTDRHDEANSRFSQFCESSWKIRSATTWTSSGKWMWLTCDLDASPQVEICELRAVPHNDPESTVLQSMAVSQVQILKQQPSGWLRARRYADAGHPCAPWNKQNPASWQKERLMRRVRAPGPLR